jgi:hypothetical protein
LEYLSKKRIKEKQWILEFVPKDLIYLTQTNKISWKNKNLKTAYIIHLINYMICKYYHTDTKEVNLSSEVMRKWYGTFYNFYLDFLMEHDILIKTKNYCVAKKCNTYTLNDRYYNKGISLFTRWKNDNPFLLKKWKEKQLEYEIQSLNDEKLINPWVKKQLIDDLYYVEVDFEEASKLLLQMYFEGKLDSDKSYLKNLLSIESIQDGTLFYVEDDYGRLHTNFTVLKKIIRTDYVKIQGEEVEELDIPNSQPTFLAILLKEKGFHLQYPEAYEFYKNIVKEGKIYDMLAEEMGIERKDCKQKMFYVLFGKNKWDSKIDRAFKKFFPEVFEWMVNEKRVANDHRTISHELQRRESKLIFDTIIYRIKKEIPQIKLFTVHDSILFPKKYKEKVDDIFYRYVDLLFV